MIFVYHMANFKLLAREPCKLSDMCAQIISLLYSTHRMSVYSIVASSSNFFRQTKSSKNEYKSYETLKHFTKVETGESKMEREGVRGMYDIDRKKEERILQTTPQ